MSLRRSPLVNWERLGYCKPCFREVLFRELRRRPEMKRASKSDRLALNEDMTIGLFKLYLCMQWSMLVPSNWLFPRPLGVISRLDYSYE